MAPADFKKKKQKLGKKKLAPTASTSTRFKTKSVTLTHQNVDRHHDADEPASSAASHGRTLPELTLQARHYSPDARRDAARGMLELLRLHPHALLPAAADLLVAAVPMLTDASAGARSAAYGLLSHMLPLLAAQAVLSPHEPLLCLHVMAALSHGALAVRSDAVGAVTLLLRVSPSALKPTPAPLLPCLLDLLGTSKGPLPQVGARRLAVLAALQALVDSASGGPPAETTPTSSAMPALERSEALRGACYGQWRGVTRPQPLRIGATTNPAGALAAVATPLHESLAPLLPSLTRCWADVGAHLPTAAADHGGVTELVLAIDCAAATITLCQKLAASAPPLRRALLPLLLRAVAPHAPLGDSPSSAGEVTSRWRRLRQGVLVLLAGVLPTTASTASEMLDSSCEEACAQLARRLASSIEADLGSRGASAAALATVDAARALLGARHLSPSSREQLLANLERVWSDAPPASACRVRLLELLEEHLLGGAEPAAAWRCTADDEAVKRFVRSLPKLIWQLQGDHPALTEAVLAVLVRVGRRTRSGAPLLHSLQMGLEPFFCARPRRGRPEIFGPYLLLPTHVRRLALALVQHLGPPTDVLLGALARCALRQPSTAEMFIAAVECATLCKGELGGGAAVSNELSFFLTLQVAAPATAEGGLMKEHAERALARAEARLGAAIGDSVRAFHEERRSAAAAAAAVLVAA